MTPETAVSECKQLAAELRAVMELEAEALEANDVPEDAQEYLRDACLQQIQALSILISKLEERGQALEKINEIRNSIVAFQRINWSEHIYPLVAALDSAGYAGEPYPEAKERFGLLVERLATTTQDLSDVVREHGEMRAWIEESVMVTIARERSRLELLARTPDRSGSAK